jgi:hypothetical protein
MSVRGGAGFLQIFYFQEKEKNSFCRFNARGEVKVERREKLTEDAPTSR